MKVPRTWHLCSLASLPYADPAGILFSGGRPSYSMKRNATLATIERAFSGVGKVLIAIVITRFLGAEGQGVYTMLLSVWAVTASWSTLGVEVANNFYAARLTSERDLAALLGNTLAFAVGAGVAATLLVGAVVAFTDVLRIIPPDLYPLLLGGTFLSCLLLPVGNILFGTEAFGAHLVGVLLNFGGFIAAIVVLAVLGRLDIHLVAALWLASLTVEVAVWFGVAFRRAGYRLRFDLDLLRKQVRYGVSGYLYNAFNTVNLRLDVLILGYLLSAEHVGYYSIAVAASEAIMYFPKGITNVVLTRVSKSGAITPSVFQVLAVVLLVLTGAVALAGPFLIPLVFGSAFVASVLPLEVLLPGTFLLGLGIIGAYALFGADRGRDASLAAGICAALTVVLNVVLVPELGLLGGALASSTAYTVFAGVVFYKLADHRLGGMVRYVTPDFGAASRLVRRLVPSR